MAESNGADQGGRPADQSGGITAQTTNSQQHPQGSERTFTQAEVNAMLAAHKRELRQENQALVEKLTTLETNYSGLTDKVKGYDDFMAKYTEEQEPEQAGLSEHEQFQRELQDFPPWAKTEKEKRRHMAAVERRYADRIALRETTEMVTTLKEQLAQEAQERARERERSQQLEQSRREHARDALLAEIAASHSAIDPKAVQRLFRDDLMYDDNAGQWRYKNADGELEDPRTGIGKVFPDYLRRPAIGGGSGSGGGARAAALTPQQQLTAAQAEVEQLAQRAQQTQRPDDLHRWLTKKRAVDKLREAAQAQAA